MKFKINQNELYKSINIVQKAVSSRTTMPILSGILIEASNNKLILTATDLELGIKTYSDCEVIEEGSIVVHSKLLGDFIRKLPSNTTVNIEITNNNSIEIKCLNSEFNILGNSGSEYPDSTFDNQGISFEIKSESLRNSIKYTHFAAAQDNIKPIFTGCLIEIKNKICTFVALDGFRMAIKKDIIDYDGEISAVVPSKTLLEILRILEENKGYTKITISDSHISFKIENTTIISNLLEGKFIDYEGILKDNYVSVIKIDNFNFKNSIERASLLAREDKNNLIILDIVDNNMQINSASEYGNAEENIDVEKDGENIKIGFNSKYVLDVLKVIDSQYITMNLIGKNNPCFIKEKGNDKYIYMILPVRIS
ncbi:DNA polymerase-3 subunit beta [Sedimentibacter acidaminivorans]|uniref:Beta sliding clamp n=1 Tax=Sedimentibacter acidaminivorans TaxID=913099 RepID=A0ABS4GF43_9FIRM|nr:DNA polymerase III subunit beta [Sedimentibacter acidaminivorans]MBP1926299.1 DNA polymerase-3 subunit beta [Sedimentibacter acidaminivorans]